MSEARRPVDPDHVRIVRAGHGANCSSIGSVVDTLFVAAVAGGAIFAAVMAALAEEPIRVVSSPAPAPAPDEEEKTP
jgi:negative regulator of sigma E activity